MKDKPRHFVVIFSAKRTTTARVFLNRFFPKTESGKIVSLTTDFPYLLTTIEKFRSDLKADSPAPIFQHGEELADTSRILALDKSATGTNQSEPRLFPSTRIK